MRRVAARPLLVALTFLAILTACGDDDATEPEDNSTTGPVTRTITPDGGTVSASGGDGTTVTVVFPPGAVRAPISITVRPLPSSNGTFARAALEPAGAVFFAPFDVTITVPEGVDLSNAQLMLRPDDPICVPTVFNPSARTLRTTLRFFGFSDDGTVVVPAAVGGTTHATQATGGNQLGASPVDCVALAAAAQQSFDAFIAAQAFENALHAALEAAALLQQAACPEAQAVLELAAEAACGGLDDAIENAANSNTSTYGEFVAAAEPILYWAGLAQQYSPDCPSVDLFLGQIESEIQDWVLFFDGRLGTLSGIDYATFQDLKEEAVGAFEMMTEAQAMGLIDAYDQIEQLGFQPTVAKMRNVAYDLCLNDNWHYPLSRLTSTGFFAARDIVGMPSPRPGVIDPAPSSYATFSNEDIFEDIQFCATCLEIVALAASGGVLDTVSTGGQGAPGQATAEATISVPTRGTLKLGGEVWAFTCWGDLRADEELIVRLHNQDVLTLRRPLAGNEYLEGEPAEIDIQTVADEAGITPKEGTSHELTIRRKRTQCDERLWGDTGVELLAATLQWKNPTLSAAISFPDEVPGGSSTPVEVAVQVIDQFGVPSAAADTDVDLTVLGGSTSLASGRTDDQGVFRSTVTVAGGALVAAAARGAGQLTIDAEATSFEGVVATASHQASVLTCPATEHRLEENGSGKYSADAAYKSLRSTATASPGEYSYAEAAWIDAFTVEVDDPTLDGEYGLVYVKLHFKITNDGRSLSSPGGRVGIGPRNHYDSPYFYVQNFTATDVPRTHELDAWEVQSPVGSIASKRCWRSSRRSMPKPRKTPTSLSPLKWSGSRSRR